MTLPTIMDKRPILLIEELPETDHPGARFFYQIGFAVFENGESVGVVSRIEPYDEPGELGLITWLAVYIDDEPEPRVRVPARFCRIAYEKPETG